MQVAHGISNQCLVAVRQLERGLHRLCENSKTLFLQNEKGVVGTLAARQNAPYRICGGRFFGAERRRGVFTQSVQPGVRARAIGKPFQIEGKPGDPEPPEESVPPSDGPTAPAVPDGTAPPASAPPPGGDAKSEILRKMMERRAKEMNK